MPKKGSNMAKTMRNTYIGIFAIFLVAMVALFYVGTGGTMRFAGVDTGGGASGGGSSGGGARPGFAATVKTSGYDPLASSLTGVNGELWTSADVQVAGETSVASTLTALSSNAPNDFDGYIMIGNDNYESGTDRGTEYYYTKYPVSWSGHAGDISFERISTPGEGTPTWTGYDDGTVEATTNITVGSGQTVTSTELKIAAGSNVYLGNPEFEYPLAVCFNATGSGAGGSTGDWDEVRPQNYVEKIDAPDFLNGLNIINGECFVLPTGALSDYEEFRFYIVMDAASGVNPAAGNSVYAYLLDKTYFKDDMNVWRAGWGDDSETGTDSDIGLATVGNEKQIALN